MRNDKQVPNLIYISLVAGLLLGGFLLAVLIEVHLATSEKAPATSSIYLHSLLEYEELGSGMSLFVLEWVRDGISSSLTFKSRADANIFIETYLKPLGPIINMDATGGH